MKRIMTICLTFTLAVLPACQTSTVGPEGGVQPKKVCIDDLRSIQLLHPTIDELATLHSGQEFLIQWDVQHVCSEYEATVEVFVGGNETYRFTAKNATSALWTMPVIPVNACGNSTSFTLRVSGTDTIGSIPGAELGVISTLQCDDRRPPRRDQQHD